MPEYLKKRFGGVRIRRYMSILSLIMYVLRNISVSTSAFYLLKQDHAHMPTLVALFTLIQSECLFTCNQHFFPGT